MVQSVTAFLLMVAMVVSFSVGPIGDRAISPRPGSGPARLMDGNVIPPPPPPPPPRG